MDTFTETARPARRERWGPLRHQNFRLLVIGVVATSLGAAITPVALAFAVLELGGSATDLGLVVAAFAFAEVVTGLFGGVLGDRVSRRVVMEGSAAACAVMQALLAASLIANVASLPLLTAAGLIVGCLTTVSLPSSSAMTQLTVPAEQLSSAVSLRRLGRTTAQIVGYSAGGLLVANFGTGWAIAVDATTCAAAAIVFSRLRVPHLRGDAQTSLIADLRDGFREVIRRTWLWLLIGQALLYHLFYGGAQGVLGPIVIEDAFGIAAWGWSLSALMAGFVAGGLVTLRWRPRRGLATGTAMLSLTAAFPLAMALSNELSLVLLGAFLHGFGLEIFSVNWDLSIQQNIPENLLARVYSIDIVGSFVARPLGLTLAGPVAEAVGYDLWLVVIAAVMGGSALLALGSPDVRGLPRLDRGPS